MTKKRNSILIDSIHIFVLFNFAVSQPLFEILSNNVEFFTARSSRPVDILLMIGALCFLLPLLIIIFESTIRLISRKAHAIVHFFVFTVLIALISLPFLTKLLMLPGQLLLLVSLILGIVISTANLRFKPVSMFFLALTPVLLVFPIVFLMNPNVASKMASTKVFLPDIPQLNSTAPIVLVVFDELPVTSLMNENYEIDAVRYPNFSALADDSYWFRNASTVSDDTVKGAVPAIATGLYPNHLNLAKTNNVVRNIFTLFRESHTLNVFETYTQMCPEILCGVKETLKTRMYFLVSDLSVIYAHIISPPDLASRLPNISQDWKNFLVSDQAQGDQDQDYSSKLDQLWEGRPAVFKKFVNSLGSTNKPMFSYLHVLLPHIPWTYLPSGEKYNFDVKGHYGVPGVNTGEMWSNDAWAVNQGWQRHLIQLEFVDKLIGLLIQKLKDDELYERALIVITADHGVAFVPDSSRRMLTQENVFEIVPVPLLMKAPYQEAGITSDRNVETIDILPTIADMLNTTIPWGIDGKSALNISETERENKIFFRQNRRLVSERIVFSEPAFKGKFGIVEKKLSLFGSGTQDDKLYKWGKYNNLIGRHINEFGAASMEEHNWVASFSPQTPLVHSAETGSPLAVTGRLDHLGAGIAENPNLVISVNGIVAAVTTAFVDGTGGASFLAFVPEQFLTLGPIQLNIHIVEGSEGNPQLQACRIAGNEISR